MKALFLKYSEIQNAKNVFGIANNGVVERPLAVEFHTVLAKR